MNRRRKRTYYMEELQELGEIEEVEDIGDIEDMGEIEKHRSSRDAEWI